MLLPGHTLEGPLGKSAECTFQTVKQVVARSHRDECWTGLKCKVKCVSMPVIEQMIPALLVLMLTSS